MVKTPIDIAKWATASGGIATAIALVFLASQVGQQQIQTDILKSQFIEKDRPWIAVQSFDPKTITFILYNYGAIPNTDGTLLFIHDKSLITRSQVENSQGRVGNLWVVLPTQIHIDQITDLSKEDLTQAKLGTPLYIGYLIKYNYDNNQHGEYGIIMGYDNNGGNFDIIDNWAK